MRKSLGLFIVLAVSIASLAEGPKVNIQKLNRHLQKTKAEWFARDNWLNHLTKAEQQKLFSLPVAASDEVEFMDHNFGHERQREVLPTQLDWRMNRAQNWLPPIRNQGVCGSCVAFAAIGVLEAQLNISSMFINLNRKLSSQKLFSCGGGSCDQGWIPAQAAQFLMRSGVPDEACMPYQSGVTGKDIACTQCSNEDMRTIKIADYNRPTFGLKSINRVKKALQLGPVMTTLTIYEDFVTYGGGVYTHNWGQRQGGHAVSIVGYDDATQSFIIRNSWGESWGENGYAHISYEDFSGVGDLTYQFVVPAVSADTLAVLAPRDESFWSGEVSFNVRSQLQQAHEIKISLINKKGETSQIGSCQVAVGDSGCEMRWDSQNLADGRYEVEAEAVDALGKKSGRAPRQVFYVLNHLPAISTVLRSQTNLTEVLSGRVEFEVENNFGGDVPFSRLEFHVRDVSGNEKVRTVDTVLPKMILGWRTSAFPNGSYEIWVRGLIKSNTLEAAIESQHYQVQITQ